MKPRTIILTVAAIWATAFTCYSFYEIATFDARQGYHAPEVSK